MSIKMKKGDKTAIGDRFKRYEAVTQNFLSPRTPVIIRVDGNAFHTLTRRLWKRNYSEVFESIMDKTALEICPNISGVKFAYVQGDEISFLLTDYDTIETQPWFGYNTSKLVSISAGMCSTFFTLNMVNNDLLHQHGWFDSRAFNVPQNDVVNYFVWRQRDWERNSVSMFARTLYSHKELHKKNCGEMKEMMKEKGLDWESLEGPKRKGRAIYKEDEQWFLDHNVPSFSEKRGLIEQFVYLDED